MMVKAEAARGGRGTATDLTPLFSRFCPQLIPASRFCDRIIANSMIPMRSRGGGYLLTKVPKLAPLDQCPDDFSQELFRAQLHSSAHIERALLSAAFNLYVRDYVNHPERAFPFPSP